VVSPTARVVSNFLVALAPAQSQYHCSCSQISESLSLHAGELFAFGYNLSRQPYCTVTTLDARGKIVRDVPIMLQRPVMMHDCGLTEVCEDHLDICGRS